MLRHAIFYLIIGLWMTARPAQAEGLRESPVTRLVRDYGPAVVNISTERTLYLRKNPFWGKYGSQFDVFFERFYKPQIVGSFKLKGVGSGVVVRDDGLILTNAHVVHMSAKVFVVLSDGTAVEGKLVAIAQQSDLALIKINTPHPLKAIRLAHPSHVMIGETVAAIGNPMGLENSVTVGVVSGKNRSFTLPGTEHVFSDLIQTDASINPGNSGGALLNLDGELVGINLAVAQDAQNIGFAVGTKKVKYVLEEYKKAAQSTNVPVKVVRA